MTAALRALLEGVIDYAGLFPPAQLPLAEAVENYAHNRATPAAWLLGKFVVPAARLSDLRPWVEPLFDEHAPLQVSALGRGGADVESWLANWRSDLAAIREFRDEHAPRVAVQAVEVKLPSDLLAAPQHEDWLDELLDAAVVATEQARLPALGVFFEAPASVFPAVADTIGRWHDGRCNPTPFVPGMKLRTGGLSAEDFPTAEQLAAAMDAARENGLRWKATAGLHHPLRAFHPEVGTRMHGFLNLLVACALADSGTLDREQIVEVLLDEEPSHFSFTDRACFWHDYGVPLDEIAQVRRRQFIAFGSCSFEEPCRDLEQLQLLASSPG